MNKIKVLIMALVVMVSGAVFASGQIVPKTKHITHKTWHKSKHITHKTWRKSKHIGRKVGTKTRHIVVGHHRRRRP